MSSMKKSGSSRSKAAAAKEPVDALNLPLPPVTLDFAIRGDAHRDGFYQRYIRKGDVNDAGPAMVGKGGFGTAYRFVRDDSFTPPTSMNDTTGSSGDMEMRHAPTSQSSISAGQDFGAKDSALQSDARSLTDISPQRRPLYTPSQSRSLLTAQSASGPPSPTRSNGAPITPAMGSGAHRLTVPRSKAPAVVVVKVCRTPTSGSYDELPKTGVGRSEAKAAAQEIALGKPTGEHTRIVRGEARLLRFLQMRANQDRKKGAQSHVVRLLADIPIPKNRGRLSSDSEDADDEKESYSGPPVPRLLIFERLVELDAELTPRGWAKNKRIWSAEKVELVSKDAVAGLAFLHDHNVVHGDLKPSNFMRDARTGAVKLIDLGASRRWVRLPNIAKERTSAVEELDQATRDGLAQAPSPGEILCEGLGSLTGSPHFMAPEVLLQAGRYLSQDGLARNVLDDYMANQDQLPNVPSASLLSQAYSDFKRGWGVKADIWSWGCSVISLLLRTIDSAERPSSNSVCAFDFSFEPETDALTPLWPLHSSNDSLPRFHQWARIYPLRIMETVTKGVKLPEFCSILSPPYLQMLQSSFQQVDLRPSARIIVEYLEAHANNNVEYMSELDRDSESDLVVSRPPSRAHSIARSATSASSVCASLPDEPHNIDLTTTSALSQLSINHGIDIARQPSQQSLLLGKHQQSGSDGAPAQNLRPASQQKYLQNRLLHSSLGSPATSSPLLGHASQTNARADPKKLQMSRQPSQLGSSSQVADDIMLEDTARPTAQGQSEEMSIPSIPMPLGTDMAVDDSQQTTQCDEEAARRKTPQITLGEVPVPNELGSRCRRSTVTPANLGRAQGSGEVIEVKPDKEVIKQRRGSIFARMASSMSLRHSYAKMSDASTANGQAHKQANASNEIESSSDTGMEELANASADADGEDLHARGRSSTLRNLSQKWMPHVAGSRSSTSLVGSGARRMSVLGVRQSSIANLRDKFGAKSSTTSGAANANADTDMKVEDEIASYSKADATGRPRSVSATTGLGIGHLSHSSKGQTSRESVESQDDNILGLDLGAQTMKIDQAAAHGTLRDRQKSRSAREVRSDSSSATGRHSQRSGGDDQDLSNAEKRASFLDQDPYGTSRVIGSAQNKSRGAALDSLFDGNNAQESGNHTGPGAARRQRSWSSFFKRKKQGV